MKSFVALAKELLCIDGVQFLFSEKFSQDPLEEHFGRHRRSGGCSDNPTLLEFGNQELALNVMRSDLMQEIRGNTRGKDKDKDGKREIDICDTRELPKKIAKKKFS